ncbi:MAG: thioredoxin [Clostridiales Family XIII bacterium]|jgi:thioredoxin 1|nr:thioredoxin [Clostridiales Family XIII bacterium]
MSEIKHLSDDNYAQAIASGVVVVDFYADWCGPCKMMAPVFEEAAQEYDGRVSFAKLDIDAARQIAVDNKVMSIPTLLFFKDGEQKDRVTGVIDKATLSQKLDAIL